jgi:uncharacterized protein YbcI
MSDLDKNTLLTDLNSYIGKLIRDRFGKGPESVYVSMNSHTISFHIRGFLTPMEMVLMNQKEQMTVQKTRDLLMDSLVSEVITYIKVVAGFTIDEFYYDWSLQNRTGVFVGISHSPDHDSKQTTEQYENKEKVHHQISIISKQAEKIPNEIFSYFINPRTLIVIRKGILVSIEKELIELGHAEVLKIAKRTLEKRLLHNNMNFKELLKANVIDLFVDWDFARDKSVIVFVLKPTNEEGEFIPKKPK